VAAKRPKKDVAAGKTGGSSKPKPKKKTSRSRAVRHGLAHVS
jgi:hypothetical protein